MNLSPELIILIMNLSFLGIIVLAFLAGLMKGLYKTTLYLVFSLVFFVVGILLIGPISEWLLGVNLSFLNNFLPENFKLASGSIRASLPEILKQQFPEQQALFVEGSETMALAYGIIKMALRLVLVILLVLLNATILKIFPLITWLFIRPKRDEFTGEKPKKHRLWGGLVGAVKGLAVTVLVAVPLAGIASLAASAETVLDIQAAAEAEPEAASDEDDEFEMIFDALGAYRKTMMGVVYGFPVGGNKMDEVLFDKLLEVKVVTGSSKQKLMLRRDIQKSVNILEIVIEANDGSAAFDPSFLFKITEEQLTQIQKEIKGITLLNIAKNVGAEYGYDYIVRENLHESYEDDITLAKLKEIDLNEEFEILINVVKIINQSEAQEDVFNDIFALTNEEAQDVFDELAELKLIQMGLPIGFNFFLGMDQIKETIETNNIDMNSIQKPTKVELISDFKNIVNIYTLARDMEYTGLEDFENMDQQFFIQIEDVHVVEMFLIVFDFSFIYNNDEFFANVVYDFATGSLPEEYKDIIERDLLVNNFNASELSTIALLGKLLLVEGLMDEGAEIDIVAILTESNIDKIATYISSSNILSAGTNGILDVLTADFAQGFTIEVPANFSFKGASGKTELKAILYSVKDIMELGILEAGFDYASLTEQKIETISTNFANSQIIRYNLSPMINHLTSQTDFSFITSDEGPEFWTKDEIFHTLNAVKIFSDGGIDQTNIHSLDAEVVNKVALSKTISKGLKGYLENENEPGGSLAGQLVIPEDLIYYSTEDEGGEIYYLFVGLKEMLGTNPMGSFNPVAADIIDMDLNLIFASKILEATVVEKHLKPMFTDPHLIKYLVDSYEDGTEFDFYIDENPTNPDGDSKDLLLSLARLDDNGISYQTMGYSSFITALANPVAAQEINNAVIDSAILNASLPKLLNQMINVEGGLNLNVHQDYDKEDLSYWGEVGTNKELYFILDGLLSADNLKGFDYLTLNDTNKAGFKVNAKKVAKSETLRQMLPRIITESNLTMANSLRSTVDPNTLTELEWNNEIDILTDIIVLLNENPTVDFDAPTPADVPVVIQIRDLMIGSLLYDETKINL